MNGTGSSGLAILGLCASGCLIVFDGEEYTSDPAQTTGSAQTTTSASTGTGGSGGSEPPVEPCDNGKCDPVDISAAEWNVDGLVVDDTHVYWVNAGGHAVRKAPNTGLGTVETITTESLVPASLVSDGTYIYWHTGNVVHRTLMGVAMNPVEPVLDIGEPVRGLAVDDAEIYFAVGELTEQDTLPERGLFRAPKAGGGAPTQIHSGLNQVYQIASYGDRLWLTDTFTGDLISISKMGGSADVVDGPGRTADSGPWTAMGVFVNSLGVYWCQNAEKTVWFLPNGSTEKRPFAENTDCDAIIGDDTWIYWVDNPFSMEAINNGKIKAKRTSDDDDYTIASSIWNPNAVTFDADAVYYGTSTDPGKIVRVPVNR